MYVWVNQNNFKPKQYDVGNELYELKHTSTTATKPNMMGSSKQMEEPGSTSVSEVSTHSFCWEVDLESPAQEAPDDNSLSTIGKKIIPTPILTILMLKLCLKMISFHVYV